MEEEEEEDAVPHLLSSLGWPVQENASAVSKGAEQKLSEVAN